MTSIKGLVWTTSGVVYAPTGRIANPMSPQRHAGRLSHWYWK